ncbi:MAG: homoserine dehydrogenase [Phycisphaeraceae bacterium]|nr:homoserine dehydrogenase [Phycisphaeraceae bacterium]
MSQQPLRVGMIGCGTVGSGVARLLRDKAELYAGRAGVEIELARVLVRSPDRYTDHDGLADVAVTDDPDQFFGDLDIVIELAGGRDSVGDLVRRALESGCHVVTANKALLAAEGPELFALAREHDVAIAFEASCGGGIPMITALKFGLMANQIQALYGILNGTCNYILTAMSREGCGYDEALSSAQELGYAEADPTLDVSGRDAAEKLAILASLAFGVKVSPDQVACRGIEGLDLTDLQFGAELGYDMKLLAIAEQNGEGLSLRTEPCLIHRDQPLAQVHGPFNALSAFGDAVGHSMYLGRGAGEQPTASAVVSDLLNLAGGWYPQAFGQMNIWPGAGVEAGAQVSEALHSRFYVRISALDVPGVMAKVSTILGDAGISLSALLQHESAEGEFVPVVITTHEADAAALSAALSEIEALDVIDGMPVHYRVVEMPAG